MAGDEEIRSPEDAMWASEQVPAGLLDSRVRMALAGLTDQEHAREAAWPYGSPPFSAGRPMAALDAANRRALPAWRRLPTLSLESVRQELETEHAVVVSLWVVHGAWQAPGGEIDAEPNENVRASHAVLAVGVSEDGEEPENVVIKNSWGGGWGRHGYGFVSRRYLDAYGLWAHVLER